MGCCASEVSRDARYNTQTNVPSAISGKRHTDAKRVKELRLLSLRPGPQLSMSSWSDLVTSQSFNAPIQPGADGPLGIAYPKDVPANAVVAAAAFWCLERMDFSIEDNSVLIASIKLHETLNREHVTPWFIFALRHAHQNPTLKVCFLRVCARLNNQSRTSKNLLGGLNPLVNECARLGALLAPDLRRYFSANKLQSKLRHIQVPKWRPTKLDGKRWGLKWDSRSRYISYGKIPLNQDMFTPFLDWDRSWGRSRGLSEHLAKQLRITTPFSAQFDETMSTWMDVHVEMLHMLGEFIEPWFNAALHSVVQTCDDAQVSKVPRKKTARILGKVEHRTLEELYHLGTGAFNLDLIRAGITSEHAEGQCEVWTKLKKAFPGRIIRVKNLFTVKENQLSFSTMRHILVNVVIDTEWSYLQWVSSPEFKKNLTTSPIKTVRQKAAEVFKVIGENKFLANNKVAMACEVQLHLQRYLQTRKLTHLWFKVERCEDDHRVNYLHGLSADCADYIDKV